MPDHRQVCRNGTPSPFKTVARARKAGDMVVPSNSQLLTHFIWVFGPRYRGPFFCLTGKLLRKKPAASMRMIL